MAQLLRLIAGDKRNPTRTLAIANSTSTANIHLRSGGFSPGPGPKKVYWSGQTPRQDGQKRLGSIRDNSKQVITYDLNGGSAAELGYLQREITRFFEDAGLYEEEKISVPCWLEYRWHDNLDDVPAPTFGQFSYYIRILDGGPPQWPKTLHNTGVLTSGNIEEVMCELTCEPFWEGLQQTAAMGTGQLEHTPHGVLVADAVTNLIVNPSFAHATFDTGWSYTTLHVVNETRAGYTRSHNSSVRVTNSSGAAIKFTVNLTLAAVGYIISGFFRREDGAAVTSADVEMYGQGNGRTTTFVQVDGGPWYLAYAPFTGVAAASSHGFEVKSGKQIYADDIQLETTHTITAFPSPFCNGDKIGCTWSGTAHNSSSSRPAGFQKWPMTNEFTGQFTIAGWITPHWSTAVGSGTLRIFSNFVTSDDQVTLSFTYPSFVLLKVLNSTSVSDTGISRTIAYGDRIHIAVVQDAANCRLYVNGVEDSSITVGALARLATGGTLSIGSNSSGSVPGQMATDGWRVWGKALTATQVLNLYTAGSYIKEATGGILGPMPAFWTKDGDNILDNVNDTNRDNYGVVVGVPGDVEAKTEWRIQLPTSTPSRVTWIGRKATDINFDAAILYNEMQGTGDAGSSGGEYETVTTSVTSLAFARVLTQRLNELRGRYQWLGRIFVSTNSITMKPGYALGATGALTNNYGDDVTIATNASFIFRDIGELAIHWDDRQAVTTSAALFLSFTPTTGSTTTRADFFQLMPWPWCRVEALDTSITIVTGDLLLISDTIAYINTAANLHKYTFEHRGAAVNVVPNKYNTIYMLQGEEGAVYDITDTGEFTIYITPRWLLPGGAVA